MVSALPRCLLKKYIIPLLLSSPQHRDLVFLKFKERTNCEAVLLTYKVEIYTTSSSFYWFWIQLLWKAIYFWTATSSNTYNKRFYLFKTSPVKLFIWNSLLLYLLSFLLADLSKHLHSASVLYPANSFFWKSKSLRAPCHMVSLHTWGWECNPLFHITVVGPCECAVNLSINVMGSSKTWPFMFNVMVYIYFKAEVHKYKNEIWELFYFSKVLFFCLCSPKG